MNKLQGHIQNIKTQGNLSEVTLILGSSLPLKVLVIDTPDTAEYLGMGRSITALFKETAVIISTNMSPELSMENKIPCHIKSIENGILLSSIVLESDEGILEAIIPAAAADRLQLREQMQVLALVKLNEIMLSGE